MHNFDISKLTNLKSISLHGGILDRLQRGALLYILSSLNAPSLRQVTLTFRHDSRFKDNKEIDQCLAEKFKHLDRLIVECIGPQKDEIGKARCEIQDMFPQMERRGMLVIRNYTQPFRY